MPSTAELRLDAVSCHYGDVRAVDDVTLAVPPGSYVVLLGPSGSGKTTLLSMLGGFTLPTAGRVFIGGEDGGISTEAGPEERLCQRAAHDAEEGEGRESVDRDVDEMVAPRLEAAEGVADGEGKVGEGASAGAGFGGRMEDGAEGPELSDGFVFGDGSAVVVNEAAGKTVGVGERDQEHDRAGTGGNGCAR
eukprot:gene15458-biopygen13184